MTPSVVVDLKSAVPVYEQVRAQLAGYIRTGAVQPGDRLPTVRGLAADLGVAINTVARAYAELEAAGLVASRRRLGTVVTAADHRPIPAQVLSAADQVANQAVALGISDEVVLDVLRAALRRARNL